MEQPLMLQSDCVDCPYYDGFGQCIQYGNITEEIISKCEFNKENKVMKANEIQIGDWVYSTFSKLPCKVMYLKLHESGYASVETTNVVGVKDIASLSPIPLTPEILEKNGFKKYNELYRLDVAEGVFVNADFKSKEPFVSIHNTCYRATPICWYLHQLQHALRLCGIEKEIEL